MEALDEDWLEILGFQLGGLDASIIIAGRDGSDSITLKMYPPDQGGDDFWTASLIQAGADKDENGLNDDLVCLTAVEIRTRDDVADLLKFLGHGKY